MPTLTGPITPLGAVIDILVGVSAPATMVLRRASKPIPQSVPLRADLDTGSFISCLDAQAILVLGLHPAGQRVLSTASTGAAMLPCDEYKVSLTIVHPSGNAALNRTLGLVTVADLPLAQTGIPALIGRDLLDRWEFLYDGRGGRFTLDY
ncbi:MAG TPA: hypothetical protein VKI65_01400 [Gemmataceae bacterium]|nr:hypothetical protein [Gemmataceae bacterium]